MIQALAEKEPKTLRVYGYVRLSRDEDKEQNSLSNQKKILMDYAKQNGYNIVKIFQDDNVSGMTFDREGLDELKDLVEEGEVDILLVKDLSRIGRHKAYTALFLDHLRSLGVKVISVTENIDNFNENDDLVIGLKQIINEQYAKDISRKVRAAFKQKQKEGLVIIPPFGYIKEGKEIKIDEECANIVRLIFDLYINGYGAKKIASYLTEHHYHTPSWYQNQRTGKVFHAGKKWIGQDIWSDRTVSRILKNDAYIGTLRCGVTSRSVIYHYKKEVPKEEHIVHEDFYPPIIDENVWKTAQVILNNRSNNNIRASSNSKIHRYAGLLICGDCGASFVAKKRGKDDNQFIEYVCNGYHRFGRNVCTPHRIREEELDNIVYSYLNRLKEVANNNIKKVDLFIKEWNYRKIDYSKTIEKIQYEIEGLKNEIKEYARQLAKNLIDEEIFRELVSENNEKIELLQKNIQSLETAKEINKKARESMKNSLDILNNILMNRELTNAQLQVLVNKIEIKQNEDDTLSLNIVLNMPFKQHLIISNAITEDTSTCVDVDSVINLIDSFANIDKLAS